MSRNKLLSIITLYNDTCESLARDMGITPQTFSNKLNEKGKRGFTQPEIMFIKKRYNLSAIQVDDIFFNKQVSW